MKKKRQDVLIEEAQKDDNIDFETIENKKRILLVLKKLPAAFLSEIAWEANLSEYQARILLTQMYHDEWIDEVPVTFEGEPRLIIRVPEMSAKGQGGYANFKKKRWYAITEQGRLQI